MTKIDRLRELRDTWGNDDAIYEVSGTPHAEKYASLLLESAPALLDCADLVRYFAKEGACWQPRERQSLDELGNYSQDWDVCGECPWCRARRIMASMEGGDHGRK